MDFEGLELKDVLVKKGKVCRHFSFASKQLEFDIQSDVATADSISENISMINASMNQVFNFFDAVSTIYDKPGQSSDGFDSIKDWYDKLFAQHMRIRSEANTKLASIKSKTADTKSTGPLSVDKVKSNKFTSLKLSKVDIPKFDGKIESYLPFKRDFLYLTSPMSNEDKHISLRQAISDNNVLKNRIGNFPSFDEAWSFLERKYADSNRQYKILLEEVQKLPKIHNDGKIELSKLDDFLQKLQEFGSRFDALGKASDFTSEFMLTLVEKKMPADLVIKWYEDIDRANSIHDITSLMCWLDKQSDYLSAAKSCYTSTNNNSKFSKYPNTKVNSVNVGKSGLKTTEKKTHSCIYCKVDSHTTVNCEKFIALSPEKKHEHVKQCKACFKCIKQYCKWSDCKAPVCGICNGRHHNLLHLTKASSLNCNVASFNPKNTCLPVVRICATDKLKRVKPVYGNLLFDSGSQITLIKRSFAAKIGLNPGSIQLSLSLAAGEKKSIITETCSLIISSTDGSFSIPVNDIPVLTSVCSNCYVVNDEYIKQYSYLNDLSFNVNGGPIDILLGTDVPALHVDLDSRCGDSTFDPVAKLTKFGWTLVGPMLTSQIVLNNNIQFNVNHISTIEEINLKQFMQSENLGIDNPNCHCFGPTPEEREVEEKMKGSIIKVGNRYQISLPWKSNPELLPKNWDMAFRRLLSTEKRLQSDPTMKKLYGEKLQQNLDDGFTEEVSFQNYNEDPGWLLPHLPIFKQSSSTPLRVCFDSAALSDGVSLNSFLFKGPNVYGDIFKIFLRFRKYENAINADIKKMFNQILLDPEDKKFHRFLWRSNVGDPIKIFQWKVLPFGDTSCPSASGLVMKVNALSQQVEFPRAAEAVLESFWVDDLTDSCLTDTECMKLKNDLISLLSNGGFQICKWRSNVPEIRDTDYKLDTTVVLGCEWNMACDTLKIKVHSHSLTPATKRSVLGCIASCYDLHGFSAAVTIKGKIFLQKLWIMGCKWDEILVDSLQKEWNHINSQLQCLQSLEFFRCVIPTNAREIEVHTFTDGGEKAFGCVVFLRINASSEDVIVRFVAAKAKLSPIKTQTIPRIELNGCLIGARLCRTIVDVLKISDSSCRFWCDSEVVLKWLSSESRTFKPYVQSRISNIQMEFAREYWSYVPSGKNHADCLTKGLDISLLSEWLAGPEFLKVSGIIPEFVSPNVTNSDMNSEILKPYISLNTTCGDTNFIDFTRFSSMKKLLNTVVVIIKFIDLLKSKIGLHIDHDSDVSTYMNLAELCIIKIVQKDLDVTRNPALLKLSPVIDTNGIWRADSRIKLASNVDYDTRFPILLPKHQFSKLLVKHYHQITVHAGTQRIIADIRRKYWILGIGRMANNIGLNCKFCQWLKAKPCEQQMSPLPIDRLKLMSPAFYTTYVDFMGPIMVKVSRNVKTKGYASVFSCTSSRAVHIEIVEDLTTQSFLLAFRRFVSLKGSPHKLFSDNGSNFIGAYEYLKKVLEDFKSNDIQKTLWENHQVIWQFATPLASHHNGTIETMIRSVRKNLFHVVKNELLTFNEWATVLHETAQIINSRPLYPSSANPLDDPPITPNHLLIGRSGLTTLPGPFYESKNPRHRLEFCEMLVQKFWDRWMSHFLPSLIPRGKWYKERHDLAIGDLVVLIDSKIPRASWKMGIVENVFPGKDNLVRSVQVKTGSGSYQRPISKLSLLLSNEALKNNS